MYPLKRGCVAVHGRQGERLIRHPQWQGPGAVDTSPAIWTADHISPAAGTAGGALLGERKADVPLPSRTRTTGGESPVDHVPRDASPTAHMGDDMSLSVHLAGDTSPTVLSTDDRFRSSMKHLIDDTAPAVRLAGDRSRTAHVDDTPWAVHFTDDAAPVVHLAGDTSPAAPVDDTPSAVQLTDDTAPDAHLAGAEKASATMQPKGCGPITWQVSVAYHGPSVGPWAWHPDQPMSVEGLIGFALAAFSPKRSAAGRHVPVWSAGRTDKGVSAIGQIISFKTELCPDGSHVMAAINARAPGVLHAYKAVPVPKTFHATFAASWRRYIYLFPLRGVGAPGAQSPQGLPLAGRGAELAPEAPGIAAAAPNVDVHTVNRLLAPLVGKAMDYEAYARDTPPGKNCVCRLLKASACLVALGSTPALCIELVADRFVRHMVRVLVATAVREALPGAGHAQEAGEQALVRLAEGRDRKMTAPPAPALGLCFVSAGYQGEPPPP
eukprot:jgi/Botrbrau1/7391/Bobra.0316s0033.1